MTLLKFSDEVMEIVKKNAQSIMQAMTKVRDELVHRKCLNFEVF